MTLLDHQCQLIRLGWSHKMDDWRIMEDRVQKVGPGGDAVHLSHYTCSTGDLAVHLGNEPFGF